MKFKYFKSCKTMDDIKKTKADWYNKCEHYTDNGITWAESIDIIREIDRELQEIISLIINQGQVHNIENVRFNLN